MEPLVERVQRYAEPPRSGRSPVAQRASFSLWKRERHRATQTSLQLRSTVGLSETLPKIPEAPAVAVRTRQLGSITQRRNLMKVASIAALCILSFTPAVMAQPEYVDAPLDASEALAFWTPERAASARPTKWPVRSSGAPEASTPGAEGSLQSPTRSPWTILVMAQSTPSRRTSRQGSIAREITLPQPFRKPALMGRRMLALLRATSLAAASSRSRPISPILIEP